MDDVKLLTLRANWKALTKSDLSDMGTPDKYSSDETHTSLFGGISHLKSVYSEIDDLGMKLDMDKFRSINLPTIKPTSPSPQQLKMSPLQRAAYKSSSSKQLGSFKMIAWGDQDMKDSPTRAKLEDRFSAAHNIDGESKLDSGSNKILVEKQYRKKKSQTKLPSQRSDGVSLTRNLYQESFAEQTEILTHKKSKSKKDESLARLRLLQGNEIMYHTSKPMLIITNTPNFTASW